MEHALVSVARTSWAVVEWARTYRRMCTTYRRPCAHLQEVVRQFTGGHAPTYRRSCATYRRLCTTYRRLCGSVTAEGGP